MGIYNTFWIAVVVWLVFNFILSQTRTGRHLYAIGSNIDAAKLSGVSVYWTTTKAYLVSAACAGLVGLIQCATTGTGTMDAGLSYEMYAVAASVIGGVSTLGGQGILLGTVVGAGVWSVLSNGLQFAGVAVGPRNVIIGVTSSSSACWWTWSPAAAVSPASPRPDWKRETSAFDKILRRNHVMKKLFALVLCLMLALGCTAAFAEGETTPSTSSPWTCSTPTGSAWTRAARLP